MIREYFGSKYGTCAAFGSIFHRHNLALLELRRLVVMVRMLCLSSNMQSSFRSLMMVWLLGLHSIWLLAATRCMPGLAVMIAV